jgi:hypothetical protein
MSVINIEKVINFFIVNLEEGDMEAKSVSNVILNFHFQPKKFLNAPHCNPHTLLIC